MSAPKRFSARIKAKHGVQSTSGDANVSTTQSEGGSEVSITPIPEREEGSSKGSDGAVPSKDQLGTSLDAALHDGLHIAPRSSINTDNELPPHSPSHPSNNDLHNVGNAKSEWVFPFRDREVPRTPRQTASDSALLHNTPSANHSQSYGGALSSRERHKVEEANKYLRNDLHDVRILSAEEWALNGLNLDLDQDKYRLTAPVKSKFDNYCQVVDKAKNERDKDLYPAFVDLLNSISNGEEKDNIIFYKQDPVPVRGSHVMQVPDMGAVFQELIDKEKTSNPPSDGKIAWGHLCTIVEGKLEKGKMVLAEFGRDKNKHKVHYNKRQNRGKDAEEKVTGRSSATRRKNVSQVEPEAVSRNVESVLASITSDVQPVNHKTGFLGPDRLQAAVPRLDPFGARMQVAGYARDVLSHGIIRSHVIVFLVDSKLVRGIFYDRSGIFESAVLNLAIKSDQLIFAKMIKQMRALPPEGLGIVPNLDATFMKDRKSLRSAEEMPQYAAADGPPSNEIFEWSEGSLFDIPYKNKTIRTVRVKRVLFRSNGIIGRGTIVMRVACHCDGKCDWCGKKLILKLSFPAKTRVSEQTFMDRCRELAQGDHAWVLNHLPHIYWTFDIQYSKSTPQANFKKKFKDDYEMRLMRGSIQEELRPLSSLTTATGCAQVFYDVVQCHHWAWKYPQILHRDISQGNILVREKNGEIYGVLNDWDLAIWLNDQRDGPTSKFRTGTKPYMAREQHGIKWQGPHRFRHDLESVFYVILLLVSLYSSPKVKAVEPDTGGFMYEEWHKQDDTFLAGQKGNVLHDATWQPSVTPFFSRFDLWLTDLHRGLRRGLARLEDHKDAMEQALKRDQEMPSFDYDTLDNYFSYEKVVSVMHRYDDEELKTRGSEWRKTLLSLPDLY